MTPEVSVVVPARNEAAFVRETVPRILRQEFPGEMEFLFIEGRSDDGTRELLEELIRDHPRVRILDNPARKLAHALNIGLEHASGEFVVQMEAHTYYPPDYVSKGVERLRRGDVAWVTGPPVPYGVDRWSRRVAIALDSWLGTGGSRKWSSRLEKAASVDGAEREADLDTSVFGGVWRRSLLEELGGWDERFEVNQDVELAARVQRTGGRIVCLNELGAHYVPRGSLRGLARQYFAYGSYRVRTSQSHPEALRFSQLLAPTLVLAVICGAIAPGDLRRASRIALLAYVVTLIGASADAATRVGVRDAAGLPAVFATMHMSWGAGFLASSVKRGPPLRAIARAIAMPFRSKTPR